MTHSACAPNTLKNGTKYNLICFGFMPWSNMWKRNQSMMAESAELDFIDKVIFVNPEVWIRQIIRGRNKNSIITSGLSGKLIPVKKTSKIWVYTPLHLIPFKKRFPGLQRVESLIMLTVIRHLNFGQPHILFMNCPNILSQYVLDKLLEDAALSIFDFSDDFVELVRRQEDKEFYSRNVTKYARTADIVLTVNEHLKDKYGFLNKNIHVLRNATNYSNFDRARFAPIDFLENIKGNGQPIIGYTGWINRTRIDFGLLDFLVERRPEWQFVFIGPADDFFIERYSRRENIHLLPPVDYKELPDYINYFDAAIVPFQINEHTKGNDLLKFHDYLAMGKPVISTNINSARNLTGVIEVADGPAEFLTATEKFIGKSALDDIKKRKETAFRNSWHTRIRELEDLMRAGLDRGI